MDGGRWLGVFNKSWTKLLLLFSVEVSFITDCLRTLTWLCIACLLGLSWAIILWWDAQLLISTKHFILPKWKLPIVFLHASGTSICLVYCSILSVESSGWCMKNSISIFVEWINLGVATLKWESQRFNKMVFVFLFKDLVKLFLPSTRIGTDNKYWYLLSSFYFV